MAHSLVEFRRYLGARAAHYTEAQLRKALDAASFERVVPAAVNVEDAKLLDVKTVTQPDDYSCGACASMSVGRYYGVGPDSLDQWKEDLGTNIHTSTRPPDIVNYFQQLGCQVEARNNLTIDDLRDYWQRGWPVICCFQEWGDPDPKASFYYGHYATVVGVGLGMVFVSDPSINNVLEGEDSDQASGLTMITEENWLRNWHDEDVDKNQYIHYGIAVGPPAGGGNRIAHLTKAHINGKDHLDRLGGELPVINPEMLKRADFITYPKRIKEGSNCSSCRFNQKIDGQHQCTFHDEAKRIDLRGQPVGPRNCCGEWDAPGTLRSWQNETVTKAWESSKHPRGGDPRNPGWFSHGAGTRPAPGPDAPYPSFPGAPGARTASFPPPVPESAQSTRGQARPTPADYLPSSSAERSPLHRRLEESPAAQTERLDAGVNKSYILTLEDGTQGVYKPAAGERESAYASVPFQTAYRREVAASRIADVLGLNDLVPTTTFRGQEGDDIGSIQAFVPETLSATKSAQPFDGPDDLARAAAFDYLLLNHDRHYGNWLLIHNKKLTLIDNGTSLPVSYDMDTIRFTQSFLLQRAVAEDMPLPNLSSWKHKWQDIERELLDAGIEEKAIDLTHERFDELTRGGHKRFGDLSAFGIKPTMRDLVNDDDTRSPFWGG